LSGPGFAGMVGPMKYATAFTDDQLVAAIRAVAAGGIGREDAPERVEPPNLRAFLANIPRPERDRLLDLVYARATKPLAATSRANEAPEPLTGRSDSERIRDAIRRDRRRMTVQLARELGVPEAEVIRCLPDGCAVELDVSRWEELVRRFESLGQVHVIVTNGSVTLESFGQFGNFSTFGEYFNVQTKTLDMHIRHGQLAAAFAVEKPGHLDGVNTLSFQFYDGGGAAAFKVFLTFGGSAPPPEKLTAFEALRDEFRVRG